MTMLNFNPSINIFGVEIYYYAILIMTGVGIAIFIMSRLLKSKGLNSDNAVDYALIIMPLAILGARLYFFMFPYDGQLHDWSRFWNFRDGGLGIYGGVIFGYLAVWLLAKIKKQHLYEIGDCVMPGLLIAQSIGRWGNFLNQEAYGSMVTNPNLQFFPFSVYIDSQGAWFQATFFYESMLTLIGFLICWVLLRSKHYKTGWLVGFYGIYYGIARLFVEGLRSDSLFLYIGSVNTGVKISQAVSVLAILFGAYRFLHIYRNELANWFKSCYNTEEAYHKWSQILTMGATSLFALGGTALMTFAKDINFALVGVVLLIVAAMCFLLFLLARKQAQSYCHDCKKYMQHHQNGQVKCSCGKEAKVVCDKIAVWFFSDRQPKERRAEFLKEKKHEPSKDVTVD